MRALQVTAAGMQPTIGTLATPQVEPGFVLVKVKAAGLNPIDNIIAAGYLAGSLPHEYPVVLGRDAAGIVEAVGDGVDHVRTGQAVLGGIPLVPPVHAGTLADYALLPADAVTTLPEGLDFIAGAAIPLAACAAAIAVDELAPEAGEVVLLNGATGGVGLFALQLLVARDAVVVATGVPAETARLLALGAQTVVDYRAGSIVDEVREAYPDGVAALVTLVGSTNEQIPLGAVRVGGHVVATTPVPDADALAAAGLTGSSIFARPLRQTIAALAAQAAAGELAVEVDTVLPFERATDGLATIAAGEARGKIVVTIGD